MHMLSDHTETCISSNEQNLLQQLLYEETAKPVELLQNFESGSNETFENGRQTPESPMKVSIFDSKGKLLRNTPSNMSINSPISGNGTERILRNESRFQE